MARVALGAGRPSCPVPGCPRRRPGIMAAKKCRSRRPAAGCQGVPAAAAARSRRSCPASWPGDVVRWPLISGGRTKARAEEPRSAGAGVPRGAWRLSCAAAVSAVRADLGCAATGRGPPVASRCACCPLVCHRIAVGRAGVRAGGVGARPRRGLGGRGPDGGPGGAGGGAVLWGLAGGAAGRFGARDPDLGICGRFWGSWTQQGSASRAAVMLPWLQAGLTEPPGCGGAEVARIRPRDSGTQRGPWRSGSPAGLCQVRCRLRPRRRDVLEEMGLVEEARVPASPRARPGAEGFLEAEPRRPSMVPVIAGRLPPSVAVLGLAGAIPGRPALL